MLDRRRGVLAKVLIRTRKGSCSRVCVYLRVLAWRHVVLVDIRLFVEGLISDDLNSLARSFAGFLLACFRDHVELRNVIYTRNSGRFGQERDGNGT